jgi:hypothetical protein
MINHARMLVTLGIAFILGGSAAMADEAKPKPEKAAAAAQSTSCLRQTGSLTRANAQGHCQGFGHSYSSFDIRRTGAPTLGQALPILDPAIRTHH